MRDDDVLRVEGLRVSFLTQEGVVHAVRGVNLRVRAGETVAIVGESGCGKSVTAKVVMGILASNETVDDGRILFRGRGMKEAVDLLGVSRRDMQTKYKGRRIAMVFQDPMTSLDPTMRVGMQITEALRIHEGRSRAEAKARALKLLEQVGIADPDSCYAAYPHELSGGMRQRVVIAIALSCEPELLICDEPTTALDVTIQARILQLLLDMQRETGFAMIFITHDLGVVAKVADYVNVMYAGKVIETGRAADVFYEPAHPYTWGLLCSVPDVSDASDRLQAIPGNPPDLRREILGDAFAPRNASALRIDFEREPPMLEINEHHAAATWLLDSRAPKVSMPEVLARRIASMRAGVRTDER